MDLTEAEDIKKRWQEYTEELYKNDLHTTSYPDKLLELQVPFPEAGTSLLSQEFISIPLYLRGGSPAPQIFYARAPSDI